MDEEEDEEGLDASWGEAGLASNQTLEDLLEMQRVAEERIDRIRSDCIRRVPEDVFEKVRRNV